MANYEVYNLASPVVLFKNNEYGERLLFKNGIVNPRDELGKNGINFHSNFTSMFYKTIRIKTNMVDASGKTTSREFNINRNSLVKYLGEEDHKHLDDAALIEAAEKSLAMDNAKQTEAGSKGLRHAGRHNHRPLSSWSTALDWINGTFLSWLYQKTIGGLNRIKSRFLFVRSEEGLLEAGQILAKKRFQEAYANVPAYKNHVTRFNGEPTEDWEFSDIPKSSKDNYIKFNQEHDSDTHFGGKYPAIAKTDTSTGTTGKATEWVRSEKELETVKKSLQLAARLQFGPRRLNYINAFALGPWATGLTTYELMRDTGSVFATGPDKDKILEKLVSITNYEKYQLDLAMDAFANKHERLAAVNKTKLHGFISTVLKEMLKNSEANFSKVWASELSKQDDATQSLIEKYGSEVESIARQLNKEKSQIILAGYPPFLKDITDYAKEKGYNFEDFSAIAVVGGQAISEAMRDQIMQHGFKQIFSSYGASDLDINLGVETEYEISVRKAIEKNPELARELYGENKGLPMVFHYDPMNYHVECDDEDNLLFTCARDDRSSPRIRYDLGDKGRIYASSDIQALLAKHGIFKKPKTNLPLMFVWGRDSTVVFNGANLAFTELERAVTTDTVLERDVLKKAFYTYEDEFGADRLEIWLELNEGVELPDADQLEQHSFSILNNMVSLNQDFRYQVDKLAENAPLPMVRFFKRHESPISEAGGHRKQVLIFQKDVNLEKGYTFPAEDKCVGFSLPKTSHVLDTEAAAQAKL